MMQAGMNKPLPTPIHLWPDAKHRPNIKAVKSQFARGLTFYGNGDHKMTIYDLPVGQVVVLHAGPKTRIKVQVT